MGKISYTQETAIDGFLQITSLNLSDITQQAIGKPVNSTANLSCSEADQVIRCLGEVSHEGPKVERFHTE